MYITPISFKGAPPNYRSPKLQNGVPNELTRETSFNKYAEQYNYNDEESIRKYINMFKKMLDENPNNRTASTLLKKYKSMLQEFLAKKGK